MAYLKLLTRKCSHDACPKQATVELLNSRNAAYGAYCRPHGERQLKELEKQAIVRGDPA